jgi:hypothetical protein
MTARCPGLVQEHDGTKLVLWAHQTSLLVTWCGHASAFHMWVKCQPQLFHLMKVRRSLIYRWHTDPLIVHELTHIMYPWLKIWLWSWWTLNNEELILLNINQSINQLHLFKKNEVQERTLYFFFILQENLNRCREIGINTLIVCT